MAEEEEGVEENALSSFSSVCHLLFLRKIFAELDIHSLNLPLGATIYHGRLPSETPKLGSDLPPL
ncbi:hypothetical protein EGR_06981 [Echinococcus granulosus]|uniref:Uncharacterized protein n=1 Tax=Echinococcus granulosus TaxID=6210 RepID=W6UC40_ECHGR|nr:hypothetical protein EGR_06981 [Echinococcus granulosus]EUB58151.1 hypothetical protein EGR_06981 [Echinococcus granulosus]